VERTVKGSSECDLPSERPFAALPYTVADGGGGGGGGRRQRLVAAGAGGFKNVFAVFSSSSPPERFERTFSSGKYG